MEKDKGGGGKKRKGGGQQQKKGEPDRPKSEQQERRPPKDEPEKRPGTAPQGETSGKGKGKQKQQQPPPQQQQAQQQQPKQQPQAQQQQQPQQQQARQQQQQRQQQPQQQQQQPRQQLQQQQQPGPAQSAWRPQGPPGMPQQPRGPQQSVPQTAWRTQGPPVGMPQQPRGPQQPMLPAARVQGPPPGVPRPQPQGPPQQAPQTAWRAQGQGSPPGTQQSQGPMRSGPPQQPPAEQAPEPQRQDRAKGRGEKGDQKEGSKPSQQQMPKGPPQASARRPGPGGDDKKQPAQPQGPSEADKAIAAEFAALNLKVVPPRKVDQASQKQKPGRRIWVETNHLPLVLRNFNITAFHYDITFTPDKPKYLLRRAWNEFASRHFPNRSPSFDGNRNVVSNGPLPTIGTGHLRDKVTVYNEERQNNKEFEIEMKLANQVNMAVLKDFLVQRDTTGLNARAIALQMVDIVLRNSPANRMIQSGRLFFTPPKGQILPLGEGLEMWYGFYQSAILGWKPYVNIDISHKGFPKICRCGQVCTNYCILETIKEVCNRRPRRGESIRMDLTKELNHYQIKDLSKFMKSMKVWYQIPTIPNSKRTYKVNDVMGPAYKEKFKLDDGRMTTVDRYFTEQKNYRLQYPNLPCLWVGSREKKIMIPIELCSIKEQVVNSKLTPDQTSEMISYAATNTTERKQKIMGAIREAGYDRNPFMEEFGISVAGQFERVEARVLDPPMLQYGQNATANPRAGVWRQNAAFLKSAEIGSDWCILNLDDRTRDDVLTVLQRSVLDAGGKIGMNPQRPNAGPDTLRIRDNRDLRTLENQFRVYKDKGIKLVFVVVPNAGETYAMVKKMAELRVGILTQCIKARTAGKMNFSTINNILLKVNAKLNGTNLALHERCKPECLKKPCMIVGADVTHPSPGSVEIPSVAAVAASHDPKAFQYNMLWRLQDPRDEMIRDLENIMVEQLLFFHKKTGYKPVRIIYLRDGVSDGQIQQVFQIEFLAIRRACKRVQGDGYEPRITFVIVQKRHHTRFFPTDKRDCEDQKNFNVPAGTCVDTDIVHPREQDFYLLSHASLQGTARPTKYRLVYDDHEQPSEVELQQLTYYLCHLFTRCTRSVSYPAPTYYAHLAAFRAKAYIEGEEVQLNNLQREQANRTINADFRTGSPMFFV